MPRRRKPVLCGIRLALRKDSSGRRISVPQILRVGGHRTLLVSPDCVFDASLVPGTCLGRSLDLKGLINKFLESRVTGNLGAIFRLPRYSGTCELWAANLRNFRIADITGQSLPVLAPLLTSVVLWNDLHMVDEGRSLISYGSFYCTFRTA
jgi:hypothetical protein